MVAPRVSSAPANPAAAPPTEAPLRLPSLAVHIVAVGTVRPGTKLARDAVGQRERIESQEQFRFALHLARAFHLCNRARHIAALRNHDAPVLDDRESGFQIHPVAFRGDFGVEAVDQR